MYSNWMNIYGGMNLFGPAQPGQLTSDNDNEVLFRAVFEMLGGHAEQEFYYKPYMLQPGLHMRNPLRPNDTDAWDNTLGFCALSYEAALEIYEYGKKHWWYFDCTLNAKFSLSLWRQPAQQHVVCVAAEKYSGVWRTINFIIALFICSFHGKERTSEIITQAIANSVVKKRGTVFVNSMISFFNKRIEKRFGGWYNVYKTYYPENHPNCLTAKERYGS